MKFIWKRNEKKSNKIGYRAEANTIIMCKALQGAWYLLLRWLCKPWADFLISGDRVGRT
jgi:hypothetical protein